MEYEENWKNFNYPVMFIWKLCYSNLLKVPLMPWFYVQLLRAMPVQ